RRGCRSVVGDPDAAETGGAGRGRDGVGCSVVGLRQVAERDRRRRLVDGQRAGSVGSGVVRIVQRGHHSVAAAVGGRGCRSVVSDRNAAQTGGAGRGRGGLRRSVVRLRQVAERDRRGRLVVGQRAGGGGSGIVRIAQRGDNGIAAGVGGRGCRSVVSDRNDGQTGGAGRGGDGVGGSVVGMRQVAEVDCRGCLVDGQRAGGVGSGIVRVAQRGENGIAAGVGGHGCRSTVGNRDAAQTGGAGRGGDGFGRPVVGLRQVAEGDRRRTLADGQGAGGVGSGVVRVAQRGHNGVAADVGGH